jgi:hypothetical protein
MWFFILGFSVVGAVDPIARLSVKHTSAACSTDASISDRMRLHLIVSVLGEIIPVSA